MWHCAWRIKKKSTIGIIGRDRMLLKCEVFFSVELLNRKVQI